MTDKEEREAILATFNKIARRFYARWALPFTEDSLQYINSDIAQGFKKLKIPYNNDIFVINLMNNYHHLLTDDLLELTLLEKLYHDIHLHLMWINRVYKCPLLNNAPILVSGNYNHRPSYTVRTSPYAGCHLIRLDITAMDQHIQSKGLTDKSIAEIGYVVKYDVQDRLRLFSKPGNTWVFIDAHFDEKYVLLEEQ